MVTCQECGQPLGVIDSRPGTKGSTRRRRRCRNGHRLTTYEIAVPSGHALIIRREAHGPLVIKRVVHVDPRPLYAEVAD